MSVVKIPKPIGLIEVTACAKCGKAHGQVIVVDRGEGPYFICCATIHSVPVGDALLAPLPDGFTIEDWVPQQSMIGTVADLTCVAGHRKIRIERLEKKVADLLENGSPGVMHEVDKSFYELAIKERDFERQKVDRLNKELDACYKEAELLNDMFNYVADAYDVKREDVLAAIQKCKAA